MLCLFQGDRLETFWVMGRSWSMVCSTLFMEYSYILLHEIEARWWVLDQHRTGFCKWWWVVCSWRWKADILVSWWCRGGCCLPGCACLDVPALPYITYKHSPFGPKISKKLCSLICALMRVLTEPLGGRWISRENTITFAENLANASATVNVPYSLHRS